MKSTYKLIFAMMLLSGAIIAQSSVSGTVTDNNGDPLAGANLVVDGTSIGAAAGADGSYRIDIPSGTVSGQTVTVTASYIGHESIFHLLLMQLA